MTRTTDIIANTEQVTFTLGRGDRGADVVDFLTNAPVGSVVTYMHRGCEVVGEKVATGSRGWRKGKARTLYSGADLYRAQTGDMMVVQVPRAAA